MTGTSAAQYQNALVRHAGKLLLVTAVITVSIPLVLSGFQQSYLAFLARPYSPLSYLTIISIVAPFCYALSAIVALRWLRSSERTIKIAAMSVFLLTLFAGILFAGLLRPERFAGVVIDSRQNPPVIEYDKRVPPGMVLLISPDGKEVSVSNTAVPDELLQSLQRARVGKVPR